MTQSYLSSASEALAARPEVAEGALATLVTEKEFRYQVSRAGWKTKDIERAIDTRPRVEGRSSARWGRDSLCPAGAAFVSTMPAPSGFLDGAGCEKIVGS